LPVLLISAGFIAVIAGIIWLIKTAEILDGVEDINSILEHLANQDDQDKITSVLVQTIC